MRVLVINCGSSSVKCDLVNPADGERFAQAYAERVGTPDCVIHFADGDSEPDLMPIIAGTDSTHFPLADGRDIQAVGHRVVHGGADFDGPLRS